MNTNVKETPGLNSAVGDQDLCAWQPVPGVVWLQTRRPEYGRLLAKRDDGRVVARGVAGGYLRTFEFAQPLAWAVALMRRYRIALAPPNAGFGGAICPRTNQKFRGGQMTLAGN